MFQRRCVRIRKSSSADSNLKCGPCSVPSNASRKRLLTASRDATPRVTVSMLTSSASRQYSEAKHGRPVVPASVRPTGVSGTRSDGAAVQFCQSAPHSEEALRALPTLASLCRKRVRHHNAPELARRCISCGSPFQPHAQILAQRYCSSPGYQRTPATMATVASSR